MSPKVWIDVSDLLRWKGPKTGIPRVVESVTKELLRQSPELCSLCAFDEASGDFFPVEAGEAFRLHTVPMIAGPAPERSLPRRFAAALARTLLPETVRTPLKESLRHLWLSFRSLLNAGRSALRLLGTEKPARKEGHSQALRFSKEDVLLTLGSAWGSRGYCEALWRIKKSGSAPRVTFFIHDLIPCLFPHFYGPGFGEYFQGWALDACWVSDLFLTNSLHSKRDIQDFARKLEIEAPEIRVVRLGDELGSEKSSTSFSPRASLHRRFVLTVGTFEVRKNHQLLYQVWVRLLETRAATEVPQLVIVGHKGWLTDDLAYAFRNDPRMKGKVLLLDDVGQEELVWLYANCLFTLYPSQYEGWGLPVAESLARGKYCITTGNSSMPEIAGDLIHYHSPTDPAECHRLVVRALDDLSFLRSAEERIRAEYRITPWSRSAAETLAALRAKFPSLERN